eukprot:CAMPEP_0201690330 /NCGR_PEP_ID=MMETSP0578-20130828/3792_1 /ASSEMBLY_ACC=CAM_ASM_000663 /TAXON_ID=267565 /ORGANISM="Skeletonema grethea, Strain CCMP 1804" /LENGTH=531 /DNA_ID=CAMNT_0048175281 /DNA_START=127 /DNA_END=1722 /DNA_ORIENTATION=-
MKQQILSLAIIICLVDAFQFRPAPIIRTSRHRLYSAEPQTDINELNSKAIKDDGSGNLFQTNGGHEKAATKRKMELTWCNADACHETIREKVVGDHNHMELTAPATGQVAYSFVEDDTSSSSANGEGKSYSPAVLILVKPDDEDLVTMAVEVIEQLLEYGVQIMVDSIFRDKLKKFDNIDLDSEMIRHFDPKPVPGFGSGKQLLSPSVDDDNNITTTNSNGEKQQHSADLSDADLIVTLGGDGTIMYASHVFSGPVPPILPVAGGSMGFLTPFAREEMLETILIALGLKEVTLDENEGEDAKEGPDDKNRLAISQRANNNMHIEASSFSGYSDREPLAFGNNNKICISMRMRFDCRIFGSDGTLRARYVVLNEVVIDRGSSPYLASLECFCDDVHLTTVQADGIIFATPTGSTAYSMAAGGSVVHPAVPAIMVTPICPHVLSFRSMVFPDHVVLRCYVPSDARSTACVHFDGKHRTELSRGDSVQIEMSPHPVPTINRVDHSADWLSSLKSNFNFNTRVRQKNISTTSVSN